MPSLYDKVVSVIEKEPENRTDYECQELIYWFRLKSAVFSNLKPGKFLFLLSYFIAIHFTGATRPFIMISV